MLDPVTLALAAAVLALVSAVVAVVALVRLRGLAARLAALTRGEEGASLERVLATHLERVASLGGDVDELRRRADILESDGRRAVRRVGLVRFNPFEDTGSDQSFAIALLDEVGDGVVITSLHTRGMTRIYAKAIVGGAPEAALSDEETAAVAAARDGSLGRESLRSRTGGTGGRTSQRPTKPASRLEA